jgi:hypothetical protein
MSQTYQRYLSALNIETPREYSDWGQHYDMESQMLINTFSPLKHPIFNQINQINKLKQINQLTSLNSEPQKDIESGLKQALEYYTTNQSNKDHCKCKCTFITSLIYVSHLVLFIMLFK